MREEERGENADSTARMVNLTASVGPCSSILFSFPFLHFLKNYSNNFFCKIYINISFQKSYLNSPFQEKLFK